MSEPTVAEPEAGNFPVDLSSAGIRSQLLWASLFPLALFGLLCVLAFSSALDRVILNLALQRNAAQVQVMAAALAGRVDPDGLSIHAGQMATELNKSGLEGASLFLLALPEGAALPAVESGPRIDREELRRLAADGRVESRLLESNDARERLVAAYAPLPGSRNGLLLIQPWSAVMAPAYAYELLLGGLMAAGIALSLLTLSLSIGRVIRPIGVLSDKAARAVPDSVFHPLLPSGPFEIRRLIAAFNQMVIRLAEQQASLRQYAHKALLSQEEERERLSHELHDGALQDLLSLSQRVELCRNELESDPAAGRRRLDELQRLLIRTIDEVRGISSALRPPVLEDLGLPAAVDSLCKDLQQDRPGMRCEFIVAGDERRLPADLELAVFRVIQEALVNIRKHAAGAAFIQVMLTFGGDAIEARVRNDGAAFIQRDVRSLVRTGHLGLAGMYERTRLFGGSLEISPDEGGNTTVLLRVPFTGDGKGN